MTNGLNLLRSWKRRSHCQNNFGNVVPSRCTVAARNLLLLRRRFQFLAKYCSKSNVLSNHTRNCWYTWH